MGKREKQGQRYWGVGRALRIRCVMRIDRVWRCVKRGASEHGFPASLQQKLNYRKATLLKFVFRHGFYQKWETKTFHELFKNFAKSLGCLAKLLIKNHQDFDYVFGLADFLKWADAELKSFAIVLWVRGIEKNSSDAFSQLYDSINSATANVESLLEVELDDSCYLEFVERKIGSQNRLPLYSTK